MLHLTTALASDIGVAEAGLTALLGYIIVFAGLALLLAVVMLLGKALSGKAVPAPDAPAAPAEAAPAAAPKAPEAKGTAGTVLLHDVPEREAAMVMAVVAHRLGKPLNQLRFKSIREVKDK